MVKERSQFAQNSAQVFNRGKRLKFPIGVQPVKQISADQRETAKSSEMKLLEAFGNLNETLRQVVMGDHAKKANQPDVEDAATQVTSNSGSEHANRRATPHKGVDAEGSPSRVKPILVKNRDTSPTKTSDPLQTPTRSIASTINTGSGEYSSTTNAFLQQLKSLSAIPETRSAAIRSIGRNTNDESFQSSFSVSPLHKQNMLFSPSVSRATPEEVQAATQRVRTRLASRSSERATPEEVQAALRRLRTRSASVPIPNPLTAGLNKYNLRNKRK